MADDKEPTAEAAMTPEQVAESALKHNMLRAFMLEGLLSMSILVNRGDIHGMAIVGIHENGSTETMVLGCDGVKPGLKQAIAHLELVRAVYCEEVDPRMMQGAQGNG